MAKGRVLKESRDDRREREILERNAALPPGLVNHGNTCFMNSVLQGLIATPYLQKLVQMRLPQSRLSPALTNGRGAPYELEWSDGMRLADIFITIMSKAWKVKDARQRTSLSPKEILTTLGKKYDQYNDFRQQDAHEFLRLLLDAMRMEEFDIIKKRQPPPEKPKKKRNGHLSLAPKPDDPPQERLTSFVDSVFSGELASILICETCKHASVTNEPFDDLSLSIRQEDNKASKRDRFRQVVQKFLLSEPAPPRPSSVPPPDTSHAQRAAIPEPSADSRRLSLERDPTPIQISAPIVQPKPIVLEESSEKLTKLGRRVSLAWNKKKGKEREDSASSPGEDDTEMEDIRPSRPPTIASGASSRQPSRSPSPNPKKALQNQRSRAEAEYLRSLLSDNQGDRPLNPFSYLPPGAGILSKLAPSQGLEHCLRQFTAVELLDGENAVGCRRCWKIANGLYRPKDHEVGEGASAEHGESQWTHTIESSRSVSPASTGVISPRPDVSLSAFDLASSRSSLPSTYAPVERPLQPHPIQIPQITTEAPRSPSPQLEDARPTFARSYSEGSTAVNPDNSLKAPDPRLRMSRSRSTIAYDNDSASGQSSEENSDNESNTSAASDSEPPRRKHKIKEVLMRRAYKRYLIAKPPPVLVVHLKRFQQVSKSPSTFFGNLKKVDDYIQFPEYLDLSGFLAPSPSDFGLARGREGSAEGVKSQERREELSTYRLVAVVVHIGNMLGGHYVAYAAVPTSPLSSSAPETKLEPSEPLPVKSSNSEARQWCFISDTIVRLATLEEALKSKAYLCFYERIDPSLHVPRL